MSWVKLDDGAYEHTKLLAAGAQAAWLWVCGLSYCNGQKRRDGFIPLAKIALLYPGVGMKQAKRLVEAELWEETDGGFLIHGYHEYQPSESLSDTRSLVGKQGGIKSGEARRSKREANGSTKSKQLVEADNEPPSRPDPSRPDPSRPDPSRTDPTTAAAAEGVPSKVPCPRDLALTEDQAATLSMAGIPEYAIVASTTRFVGKATGDPGDARSMVTWRKCLSSAVTGDWNDTNRRPKPPESGPRPPPTQTPDGLRLDANGYPRIL